MPLADAKPSLGSFAWDASYSDAAARKRLVMNAGDGARYYVLVTGDTIARIGIEAPERGLEAKLTKLWGAPLHAKNPANETLTSWQKSPWRVDLACRGAVCRLAFHETLSARFFGSDVSPPGALSALAPGMSRDQIASISPQHASGLDVPVGFEDVHVKVDIAKTGALRSVVIVGLPSNALELATIAWGNPVASDRGKMWIGDRGWRAVYDAELRAIELLPYVSMSQLLGAGPGIAALTRPVLGATRDQIAAAYPTFARAKQGGSLALAPIELSTKPTLVSIAFDKSQRATSIAMALPYTDRKDREELVRLLATKWGKPAVKDRQVLAFPTGKVRIEVKDVGSALELIVAI